MVEGLPDWLAGRMATPVLVDLADLVQQADTWLEPARFQDYEGAVNGLQMENRGKVGRLIAAVDASLAVIREVAAEGPGLLVVHHGLFWGKTTPWTGRRAELLRVLVESDLAVYSQHLPLDGHPKLGNAAGLARALGFRKLKPFFARDGVHLGVQVELPRPMPRSELVERVGAVLGAPPTLLPGGGATCRRVGICTGGAGSELAQAAREGVDTFLTGEGPHWTYALAEDHGLNVLYGGHYATETFGVKALTAALAEQFALPWAFLDHPTGL
jgi:dinuclear metal center YbgI/SA1388 family protein